MDLGRGANGLLPNHNDCRAGRAVTFALARQLEQVEEFVAFSLLIASPASSG